jgi:hypothetical protein
LKSILETEEQLGSFDEKLRVDSLSIIKLCVVTCCNKTVAFGFVGFGLETVEDAVVSVVKPDFVADI